MQSGSTRPLSLIFTALVFMINFTVMDLPLVIELGDFALKSVTPVADLVWFIAGLVLLAGSSAAVLWWNRRSHSDPFV